jgi:Protein of unknown function (DUF3592)
MHILGLLVLAIATGLLATALYIKVNASRQIGWCMGRCRMVQSEVLNLYETYKPIIRFEYSFGGDTLRGKKIRSGLLQYNWRAPAERLCSRYSVGSEHNLYINEDDPTDAVLEPGGDRVLLPVTVLAFALLSVLGVSMLLSN